MPVVRVTVGTRTNTPSEWNSSITDAENQGCWFVVVISSTPTVFSAGSLTTR